MRIDTFLGSSARVEVERGARRARATHSTTRAMEGEDAEDGMRTPLMTTAGEGDAGGATRATRARELGSGYESDGEVEEANEVEDANEEETRPFAARTRSTYVGVLRRASTSTSSHRAWEGERVVGIESLDFNDVDSTWSRRRGTTRCPSAKWIVAASIGFFIGCVAFAMDVGIRFVHRARWALFEAVRDRARAGGAAFAHASVGAALAAGAGVATIYGAPRAKGAGVHYVMAVLNGIHVPNAFSLNTVVVKAIATVFSVGSGLMIGPEGPLVHIGAAIAMQFVHGASGTADLFQSDLDRSDFVSAGVAAGLAAAFGAPIGGVLYSLEEASTFWKESTTRRALLSASIATFVLALFRAILRRSSVAEHTAMKSPGLISMGDFDSTYYLVELPFFAALAAACGVVSGVVTKIIGFTSTLTPTTRLGRVTHIFWVTLSCFAAFYIASLAGSCVKTTKSQDTKWVEARTRLWCKPQEFADVGSILLSSKEDVIAWVLGAPAGVLSLRALMISALATVFGLVAAANLSLPAGLFMPTILYGGLLGRASAIVVERALRGTGLRVNHHAYALVGATAALAGTFRATVSVVVIVLEGVGKSAFLFPLLIAVASANLVSGGLFGASVYEEQLVRANIPFLHARPPKSLLKSSATNEPRTAFDACTRTVVTFKSIEKVGVVERALATTRHNGFPVVDVNDRVIGLILRKQLLVLLSRRAFVENLVHVPVAADDESPSVGTDPSVVNQRVSEYCKELSRVMRQYHHRGSDRHDRRARSSIIARLGLSDVERERRCDLGVFMHVAPTTVGASVSLERAWDLFSRLSLRHLPVVRDGASDDREGALVGIITRRDLFVAASRAA